MISEKCKNCTNYVAYYTQFSSGYGKLNHGFCSKHKKPQKQSETCENFVISKQKINKPAGEDVKFIRAGVDINK